MAARALVLIALAFGAVAIAHAEECATLMEFTEYYIERYSLLKAALESSPELEKFATSCKNGRCPQQYTILVPTDRTIEAFARGIGTNVTDLFDDPQRLEEIVRNHIIVGNNGTFVEGEEVETALPGSSLSVFTNTAGDQTCFMSWSYACAEGTPDSLKAMTICQGQTIRVNSMVMPPVLDAGAAAPAGAVTTAGRKLL